jgi:hypothetical protein
VLHQLRTLLAGRLAAQPLLLPLLRPLRVVGVELGGAGLDEPVMRFDRLVVELAVGDLGRFLDEGLRDRQLNAFGMA